jgi:hypothetical protein
MPSLGDVERLVGAECFELHALLEPVAGHATVHLVDHGQHIGFDCVVIGIAVD